MDRHRDRHRRREADRSRAATSERKTVETLALLETLNLNAPIGLGFVDRDLRRVVVNEALASYNGSTVAEQIGRRVPDLVPAVWPQMEPMYRAVLDEAASFHDIEVHGPSASDPTTIRDWSTSYFPVMVNDEVIGIGVIALDITERKKVEADPPATGRDRRERRRRDVLVHARWNGDELEPGRRAAVRLHRARK